VALQPLECYIPIVVLLQIKTINMNPTFNSFNAGKMRFENGILYVSYNQGVVIDETILIQQMMCRKTLTGDSDFFMLVDMTNAKDITDEALTLAAANPHPEHVKAIATLTKYGMDYTRSKLYSVFDRPNIKTKAFLKSEEALAWFEALEQLNLRKAS
jgi:hypothetical protein